MCSYSVLEMPSSPPPLPLPLLGFHCLAKGSLLRFLSFCCEFFYPEAEQEIDNLVNTQVPQPLF